MEHNWTIGVRLGLAIEQNQTSILLWVWFSKPVEQNENGANLKQFCVDNVLNWDINFFVNETSKWLLSRVKSHSFSAHLGTGWGITFNLFAHFVVVPVSSSFMSHVQHGKYNVVLVCPLGCNVSNSLQILITLPFLNTHSLVQSFYTFFALHAQPLVP